MRHNWRVSPTRRSKRSPSTDSVTTPAASPRRRYELISCGMSGHRLVGTDSAQVAPGDWALVREGDGLRWHRCLRCDAWVPLAAPSSPGRERVPGRDEIAVPLRGKALRDRYVLRLIAFDRAIHVVILTGLAVALFALAGNEAVLRRDYLHIIDGIEGNAGQSVNGHSFLDHLGHIFRLAPAHLREAGFAVVGYAALEAAEMVGLWMAKRWAEYLTFLATTILIPLEVYELIRHTTVTKVLTLILNVAIAGYLLLAKRLFGLRGGGRFDEELRAHDMSWEALERSFPRVPEPASSPG
jgi:uncharacterized membrane protein (DUF2068 family)